MWIESLMSLKYVLHKVLWNDLQQWDAKCYKIIDERKLSLNAQEQFKNHEVHNLSINSVHPQISLTGNLWHPLKYITHLLRRVVNLSMSMSFRLWYFLTGSVIFKNVPDPKNTYRTIHIHRVTHTPMHTPHTEK